MILLDGIATPNFFVGALGLFLTLSWSSSSSSSQLLVLFVLFFPLLCFPRSCHSAIDVGLAISSGAVCFPSIW